MLSFTITEWKQLGPDIRNINTYSLFVLFQNLLIWFKSYIGPLEKGIYDMYDPLGIKLLDALQLGFIRITVCIILLFSL